jgi:hypothetical protein
MLIGDKGNDSDAFRDVLTKHRRNRHLLDQSMSPDPYTPQLTSLERGIDVRREQRSSCLVSRPCASHRYVRVGTQSQGLALSAIPVAIAPVSSALWHDQQIQIASKRDLRWIGSRRAALSAHSFGPAIVGDRRREKMLAETGS